MRRVLSLSLLLAAGAAALLVDAPAAPESGDAAERARIEELHQRDIAATKAFDVEALVSRWTDDIVALPPGQAPIVGKAAGRADLERQQEQSRGFEIVEYEQNWEEVQVAGDYAFEWGIFKGAVRPPNGGDLIRYHFKVLRVLRREPDGWKVHRTIWNDMPAEDVPEEPGY